MISYFAPDLQLDSVLELSPGYLKDRGLQGLLLDLDCTLKDYHAFDLPAPVMAWIKMLCDEDIRLCLLSNGTTKKVSRFAEALNIPFVSKAFKPFPFGCLKALKKLSLPGSRIAVVGDQVFADVLAGRLAGLFTILVRPTSPLEPWFTRLKRPLERHYLRWWNAKNPRPARSWGHPIPPEPVPAGAARYQELSSLPS